MESYYIVRGDTAREEGLYDGELFILDDKEEAYDDGIWFIPNDGGYAQWFSDFDAIMMENYSFSMIKAYDDGIWFIPNDGGYAQWFSDFDAIRNSKIIDNHPL